MPEPEPERAPDAAKPAEEGPPTYEPPRLTRCGNLRDLLGKSGPQIDNSPPFFNKR